MLTRFKAEVTDHGAEACLPRNLTDEWLRVVSESTESMLQQEDDSQGAIATAAILLILDAKRGGKELRVSYEELEKRFQDYRIELALEEVHRRTEVKYEPATLQTIFSNRDVKTWREP